MTEPDFKDREEFDPSERQLCPDGSCTGLIGSDGRCKVCGLMAGAPDGGARVIDDHDDDDDADGHEAPDGAAARGHDDASFARDERAGDDASFDGDDDRQLCPDGNCVGLIGSDGRCKVCGQPAAS